MLVFVACVVAAFVNPNGIHLYSYVIQPQFSAVQQNFIAEWQSPNFHVLEERGFELMLLLVPVAFVLRRPSLVGGMPDRRRLLPGAVRGASLGALRRGGNAFAHMVVLGRLGADGAACAACARGWRHVPGTMLAGAAAILVVAALGTGYFVHSTLSNQARATATNFPVGASDWLAAHPTVGTRMFDQYGWGGYLI